MEVTDGAQDVTDAKATDGVGGGHDGLSKTNTSPTFFPTFPHIYQPYLIVIHANLPSN